jgi:hypothetical protein
MSKDCPGYWTVSLPARVATVCRAGRGAGSVLTLDRRRAPYGRRAEEGAYEQNNRA